MNVQDITAEEVIRAAGGAAALARRMGYDPVNGRQRVHAWLRNGIPAHVLLSHGKLFRKLIRRYQRQQQEGAPHES